MWGTYYIILEYSLYLVILNVKSAYKVLPRPPGDFHNGSMGKDTESMGSILESGRSPRKGNSNPFQ